MNVTQVFGPSGNQRVVHLDPAKTYSLSRLEGSMRIEANRGSVSFRGQTESPWVEVKGDTINGATAIRAVTFDETGSLHVQECEPVRPTMQDMKTLEELAAWAAVNQVGSYMPIDWMPLLRRAEALGAQELAERLVKAAGIMTEAACAMEKAGS